MNIIYNRATKIAYDEKQPIVVMNIQFVYVTQSYIGYVELANGDEYKIFADGEIEKMDK